MKDESAPVWRSRATSQTLTTGGVDGVPQLGVLPLAQLVLLGAGGGLGGLNLRPSETKADQRTQVSHSQAAVNSGTPTDL